MASGRLLTRRILGPAHILSRIEVIGGAAELDIGAEQYSVGARLLGIGHSDTARIDHPTASNPPVELHVCV